MGDVTLRALVYSRFKRVFFKEVNISNGNSRRIQSGVLQHLSSFYDSNFWNVNYLRRQISKQSLAKHYTSFKIWDSHGSDYEDCRPLGYKNPVRTSQETNYVSATKTSLLTLCQIWGFQGGAMRNVVFWDIRTQFVPHRKNYVSATKPRRLMLCKNLGFHGGDYEESRLVGSCGSCKEPKFRGKVRPQASGWQEPVN
jgi:hypothetical protein